MPNFSNAVEDRRSVQRLYRNGQGWTRTHSETQLKLRLMLSPIAEALDAAEEFYLGCKKLLSKWYEEEDRYSFYCEYWRPMQGDLQRIKKAMSEQEASQKQVVSST